MRSIFFVEAPFQLLSAYEAIDFYNVNKYKIVIRLSGIYINDIQLKNTADLLCGNDINVKFIFIRAKNKTVLDYVKIIYYKYLFTLIDNNYSKYFFGNIESGFLLKIINSISDDKIILIDDGVKLINSQKLFSSNHYYNLYTMLYTLGSIDNQVIDINKFKRFKKLIKDRNYILEDSVLFLGSKITERGKISEKNYITLISKISKYFHKKKLIYIPHRGELLDKLDKISNIDNCEVKILDFPIEFLLLYEEKIPSTIASFQSAALISMKKIYTDLNIVSFMFKCDNPLDDIEYEEVFDYYKKYMQVIEV